MRLKNFALGVLVCLGAVACRASYADTLTLTGTGNQVVGGVYVYPYDMSFDGSSKTIPMMCINYNDEITQGETWQVTGQKVSTSSSAQLQEDAWLFSQLGTGQYTNSDIQFAVWDILDSGVGGNPGLDATALSLVSKAQNIQPSLTNSLLNQYTILSPVTTADAQKTWTDGLPQSFVVQTSAVTPEPSSLLLLGTGLSGASLLLMRRRALQELKSKS